MLVTRRALQQRSRGTGSADSPIERHNYTVPPKQKQRFTAFVSAKHCSCRGTVSLLVWSSG